MYILPVITIISAVALVFVLILSSKQVKEMVRLSKEVDRLQKEKAHAVSLSENIEFIPM